MSQPPPTPILDPAAPPLPQADPAPARTPQVRSFGRSHPGLVRPSNEDQFLIAELTKALRIRQSSLHEPPIRYSEDQGYLFLVADGVGGHRGGEQASALAVGTIEDFVLNTLKWFFHLQSAEEQGVLHDFQRALRRADARMFEEAAQHPEFRGMGTTLTMAYCLDWQLFVLHVGDSRCYLRRGRQLYRLTHDHTLVEEMVRRGLIRQEDVAHHRLRHVITNVVGGSDPGLHVEAHKIELEPDDAVLLCSDGLTEMMSDEEIAAVLCASQEPEAICEALVDGALSRGGRDNVTVVVAAFTAPAG